MCVMVRVTDKIYMGGVIVHATIVNGIDYSASMFRVVDHATGVDYSIESMIKGHRVVTMP